MTSLFFYVKYLAHSAPAGLLQDCSKHGHMLRCVCKFGSNFNRKGAFIAPECKLTQNINTQVQLKTLPKESFTPHH